VDSRRILENLFELDRKGSKIILRCPVIPGMNDRESHFKEIANLAEKLKNILEVNVMPYHPMGKAKSGSMRASALFGANRRFFGFELISPHTPIYILKIYLFSQ